MVALPPEFDSHYSEFLRFVEEGALLRCFRDWLREQEMLGPGRGGQQYLPELELRPLPDAIPIVEDERGGYRAEVQIPVEGGDSVRLSATCTHENREELDKYLQQVRVGFRAIDAEINEDAYQSLANQRQAADYLTQAMERVIGDLVYEPRVNIVTMFYRAEKLLSEGLDATREAYRNLLYKAVEQEAVPQEMLEWFLHQGEVQLQDRLSYALNPPKRSENVIDIALDYVPQDEGRASAVVQYAIDPDLVGSHRYMLSNATGLVSGGCTVNSGGVRMVLNNYVNKQLFAVSSGWVSTNVGAQSRSVYLSMINMGNQTSNYYLNSVYNWKRG